MTEAEVQAHIATLIAASPQLEAFGEALIFSLFTDDEVNQQAIRTRLSETGVCIQIGSVETERAGDRAVRGIAADASFVVWVAESLTVAHEPREYVLREAVVKAVSAQVDAYTPRAEFQDNAAAITEQGYVLHAISFSIRVTVS